MEQTTRFRLKNKIKFLQNKIRTTYQGSLTEGEVDLHVLTGLNQLVFILKILFTFLQNKLPY